MKKLLSVLILMLSSIFAFSQIEYPRIETDSLGNKVIIMTIAQAQKIDNNMEILKLLTLQSSQCDSLSTAYLKVIDNLGKQVALLELDVNTLKSQIMDKDAQISNLQQQLSNSETINNLCEVQKNKQDQEIALLKKEVRKQKLQKVVGFAIGGVAIISSVLFATHIL